MSMAGNKTNDFYAQLEPYVDFSQGAVSPSPHTELPPSGCSCQRVSNSVIVSKQVPWLPAVRPEATSYVASFCVSALLVGQLRWPWCMRMGLC